jgi:hypothetical protein
MADSAGARHPGQNFPAAKGVSRVTTFKGRRLSAAESEIETPNPKLGISNLKFESRL